MKNKLFILFSIMLCIVLGGIAVTNLVKKGNEETSQEINIVTSFYPMYTIAANLLTDIDHVNLVNMTENATGCLHDYQITTNDMKKLENADILIINGGGMENFIEDIAKSYPDLTIINASDGISLIDESSEEEGEGESTKETSNNTSYEASKENSTGTIEESNAHVWLDMNKYEQQIDNIKNGLIQYDENNKVQYEKNAATYEVKISTLKKEMEDTLVNPINNKVIIFHDSFVYLADELGLDVAYSVEIEADSYLSAGDIAKVIDEIKKNNIRVLLTEKQYGDAIAQSIASETDAKVYTIDSLVTGEYDKDAYINGMKNNIKVLKEALYQ